MSCLPACLPFAPAAPHVSVRKEGNTSIYHNTPISVWKTVKLVNKGDFKDCK